MPLVIAGDTSHSDDYVLALRRGADRGRVKFLGYVYGWKLATLFRNAAVFVLPSEVEGQPLALLEALAYGAPAVASDIPQNVEVLEGDGLTFVTGDAESLRSTLAEALEDVDALVRRAASAKGRVLSDYDWSMVARRTAAVYERILDRRGTAEEQLPPAAPPRRRQGMKRFLRTSMLLALTPLAPLSRFLQGRSAVVLAYHDPSPETFERHVAALSARYSIVPLAAYLAAREAGSLAGLPPRPLVLTIDDGHAGNAALVPVCRRLALRPTVFACTGVPHRFWWSSFSGIERRRLESLPDGERRAIVAERAGADGQPSTGPREALDIATMRELTTYLDFQPHTRTHPVLTRCDEETAAEEIAGSKRDLEAALGGQRDVFAYPEGAFGEREERLAREAGLRYAFTTLPALAALGGDDHRLPRVVVRDDAPAWEAVVRASLLPGRLAALLPGRLHSSLQVR